MRASKMWCRTSFPWRLGSARIHPNWQSRLDTMSRGSWSCCKGKWSSRKVTSVCLIFWMLVLMRLWLRTCSPSRKDMSLPVQRMRMAFFKLKLMRLTQPSRRSFWRSWRSHRMKMPRNRRLRWRGSGLFTTEKHMCGWSRKALPCFRSTRRACILDSTARRTRGRVFMMGAIQGWASPLVEKQTVPWLSERTLLKIQRDCAFFMYIYICILCIFALMHIYIYIYIYAHMHKVCAAF